MHAFHVIGSLVDREHQGIASRVSAPSIGSGVDDDVAAIAAIEETLIVASIDADVRIYKLPSATLYAKLSICERIRSISLNCDGSRASFIDEAAIMRIIEVPPCHTMIAALGPTRITPSVLFTKNVRNDGLRLLNIFPIVSGCLECRLE